MANRPTKSKRPRVKEPIGDRVTYRELRNTPGRVWERLSTDKPLTLVAGGQPKALLIPIPDGDAAAAREAYERGRALLAVRRIQDAARRGGAKAMTLDQINRIIREARQALRNRDATLE
jgi:hypothetical protein